jgi:hypothetical protein
VAETAWRNRLYYYGDNLDVVRHVWCHGHEPTARLGGWAVPPGSDRRSGRSSALTERSSPLDDEGGYDFCGADMSYHVIQVVGVALLLAAAISVIVGVVAWPWLRRHTDRTAQGQESQRLRLRQLRLRQLRLRELRLRELRLRQRRKP